MNKRVLILGGGIGGLTAAHELSERGFAVTVLERRDVTGGKARSYGVANSATGGRKELPAEHGFRFFPGFYKHIPDTMRRIPSVVPGKTVADHLVEASKFMLARTGHSDLVYLLRFSHDPRDWLLEIKSLMQPLGVTAAEMAYFVERLLYVLTCCDDRRFAELEHQSWWDFIGASSRSRAFQDLLARGFTRSLVALRAEEGSARTVGTILLQLMLDFSQENLDRVLDGPTSEVWLTPWRELLATKYNVTFETSTKVTEILCTNNTISAVKVQTAAGVTESRDADYYISALPVEVLRPLVSNAMKTADPALAALSNLKTAWMNGIQFYLRKDVPLVHGHGLYPDTPWALTSISQAQFWSSRLANYGDGEVRGILSVDISNWDAPGILYGTPAKELTSREQIRDEVWAQLKACLNDGPVKHLQDNDVIGFSLDESIMLPNPSGVTNLEPLLINTVGSWKSRPEAATKIDNFFIASDFVRTYTDLATMEGANEAARRACNALLDRVGSNKPKAAVYPLVEPLLFKPLKAYDQVRFDLGLSHGKIL
jgi:uncharacterized protein with NAD-binding domain and iron-sulfur cluster